MRLYSAKIRLAGQVHNEVVRGDLTAPEIRLLRHIHGADAVLEIKDVGEWAEYTNDEAERDRLTFLYNTQNAPNRVIDVLGHPAIPLEKSVPGIEAKSEPRGERRRASRVLSPEEVPVDALTE